MTHKQAQEYVSHIRKNTFGFFSHLGFAAFFGDETPKYAMYPFSSCKEFPLDAHKKYYKANPDKILKSTGFLLSLNNNSGVERIKQNLHNLEAIFGFKKSSFQWFPKEKTLSIIGSKLWHATPAMLSLYMAVARISVLSEQLINFENNDPLPDINCRDAKIFRHKKWGAFIKLVKSRKIKHNPEYFFGPHVHVNGINEFLEKSTFQNVGEFFARKQWY